MLESSGSTSQSPHKKKDKKKEGRRLNKVSYLYIPKRRQFNVLWLFFVAVAKSNTINPRVAKTISHRNLTLGMPAKNPCTGTQQSPSVSSSPRDFGHAFTGQKWAKTVCTRLEELPENHACDTRVNSRGSAWKYHTDQRVRTTLEKLPEKSSSHTG